MTVLKRTWAVLVGIKDGLALLLLLLLFGLLLILFWPFGVAVPSNGTALRLQLAGSLVDQAHEQSPAALLSGQAFLAETEVAPVLQAIRLAANDKAIRVLVLDLDGFAGSGPANLQAVGRALDQFRNSGKKIVSYASFYNDGAYYLAAHSNNISLSPVGGVYLSGYGGTNLYYKGLLDKLKVDVETFRVGKFKSFVEPFTRRDSSPEARLAAQTLADDLWGAYTRDIAQQRPKVALDPLLASWAARLKGANVGQATLARNAGLVDTVATRQQFTAALRKEVGPNKEQQTGDNYNFIDMEDYLDARAPNETGPGVGIIHIAGSIIDGSSPVGDAGGDSIAALVEEAAQNSDVKALVIRIDSPGGSAAAAEQIREALVDLKQRGIPVVASFGPVAASGGYWIATAAERIYAEPTTITGSIGVFGIIPNFKNTLAAVGVTTDTVATTPFSGQPDIVGGLNEPTRALIQGGVNDTYHRFLQLVATSRHLSLADTEKAAEGRVWSGMRAKELGLVDSFGGLDAAVRDAAQRAGLKGAPRQIEIKSHSSFLWGLAGRFFSTTAATAAAPADPLAAAVRTSQAEILTQFNHARRLALGPTIQASCLPCIGYLPPARTSVVEGNDRLGFFARLFARALS